MKCWQTLPPIQINVNTFMNTERCSLWVVLQVLFFFCTSRSHQSGASVAPCRPCAAQAQKKRKQLLLTPQPLLCHPPPPPPSGRGAPHPANQSSAPPSPSHHLSFQGNRAPRALSPSRSVSILKGAASSSSSLPSVHPTVPF